MQGVTGILLDDKCPISWTAGFTASGSNHHHLLLF